MEYYSGMKKTTILSLAATQMDLKGIMLKWNKSEKDKYCMTHVYVESKK